MREEAKVERLLKKARFLSRKTFKSFQWNEKVHLPPQLDSRELSSLHFIEKHENVILAGSPGIGKTHLARGWTGRPAKRDMKSVSDLVNIFIKVWREGKFQRFRNKFKKLDLIILDEMLYPV